MKQINLKAKMRLSENNQIYTAIDFCVNVNDTFAERFNLYINHADGIVYACEIVNVECNVEYRIW